MDLDVGRVEQGVLHSNRSRIDLLRVPLSQKFCPKKAFLKDKNLFVVCKLLIIIMRDEDL